MTSKVARVGMTSNQHGCGEHCDDVEQVSSHSPPQPHAHTSASPPPASLLPATQQGANNAGELSLPPIGLLPLPHLVSSSSFSSQQLQGDSIQLDPRLQGAQSKFNSTANGWLQNYLCQEQSKLVKYSRYNSLAVVQLHADIHVTIFQYFNLSFPLLSLWSSLSTHSFPFNVFSLSLSLLAFHSKDTRNS